MEFQSTLPREERLGKVCCDIKRIKISIHAPTRGATINIGNKIHWIIYFNPRSHERSDVKSKSKKGWCIIFQSTLPREERLGKMEMVSGPHDFNPRSHERSDKVVGKADMFSKNFNPRSHERSDTPVRNNVSPTDTFQSTLPREERHLLMGTQVILL